MKTFYTALCAFAGVWMLLTLGSCKKETNQPQQYAIPANLQMVSSGYADGAATKVEIYAASNLQVGYNQLYLALYDSVSNQRITQAQVSLSAALNTGNDLVLSGPVQNPAGVNATNGLFSAAILFTQPAGNNGNWTLTIHLQGLTNQKTGSLICNANVVQPSPAKSYSVITLNDSASLFVALVQPANPQPGANSFELAIYRQINAGNFVCDSSYAVMLYATMPSMSGMNAPDNMNPVYSGNGVYKGKVDFIMDGAWQINISLTYNGEVADTSHYFAMNLQP
jgi:hypothetical protein